MVPEGMSVRAFPEQGGAKEEVGPRQRRREQALWEHPVQQHLPQVTRPLGQLEGHSQVGSGGLPGRLHVSH